MLGILMVNGESGPDATQLGFSPNLWAALLFFAAILAFCSIVPPTALVRPIPRASMEVDHARRAHHRLRDPRVSGVHLPRLQGRPHRDALAVLDSHDWYGILGLIGWAYLVASIVYLVFRNHRTALLGCIVLLTGLFAADRTGLFDHFFLADIVSIGETLGSQAAITVAGVMLATILLTARDDIRPLARALHTALHDRLRRRRDAAHRPLRHQQERRDAKLVSLVHRDHERAVADATTSSPTSPASRSSPARWRSPGRTCCSRT